MKIIIFSVILLLLFSFYLTQATTPPATMPEIPEIDVNIWEILDRALNWFFGIALIIAAIMLVYAGFNYVTASGNEEKIKTATKTLIFALIGVAIALLAKGLPMLVQDFLLGNNPPTPTDTTSSEIITPSDPLANTDFSSITGGKIPDPNCPSIEFGCAPCQYSPTANGDTYPCGNAVRNASGKLQFLL